MKNIVELRNNLAALFDLVKAGDIDIKAAAEMNNTAGKIIGTVKAELEYAALRKEVPNIEFLNGE